jgi:paraquat-inducible protein B
MRWPYPLIWLIPVIALIVAGYYYRDYLLEHGPEVTLVLRDATGMKVGETPVTHLGVPVGKIVGLDLSENHRRALARVRLRRDQDAFGKKGALYWVVRSEISVNNVNALSTLFSGPYIEANPGGDNDGTQSVFDALPSPPIALGEGLRIVLRAPRLDRLESGAPVYYRGVAVGIVESTQLAPDAAGVDVNVFIRARSAPLVRGNSQFWIVPAADIRAGLFSGIRVRVESVRSLLTGGVAFATPEKNPGDPAPDGAHFPLADEPKKDWLTWAPRIQLPPPDESDDENSP